MTEKQYSAGEKSNPGLYLYDLPDNVLEIICQLLIDYASFRPLLDVMSWRASCSTLNDVITSLSSSKCVNGVLTFPHQRRGS